MLVDRVAQGDGRCFAYIPDDEQTGEEYGRREGNTDDQEGIHEIAGRGQPMSNSGNHT